MAEAMFTLQQKVTQIGFFLYEIFFCLTVQITLS